MTETTKSILTLLVLIVASGVLTVGIIFALAAYCLRNEK